MPNCLALVSIILGFYFLFFAYQKTAAFTTGYHPTKKGCFKKIAKKTLESICLDRVSKRAGDIICNTVLLSPSLEWFPGNFKQMDLVLQREISLFATKKRKLCSSTWAFSFYSLLLLPLVIQEPLKGIKAEL